MKQTEDDWEMECRWQMGQGLRRWGRTWQWALWGASNLEYQWVQRKKQKKKTQAKPVLPSPRTRRRQPSKTARQKHFRQRFCSNKSHRKSRGPLLAETEWASRPPSSPGCQETPQHLPPPHPATWWFLIMPGGELGLCHGHIRSLDLHRHLEEWKWCQGGTSEDSGLTTTQQQ